ncbi:hypothetical protein [Effusibacillus lacus]|uniref:Uncharacterized protein n=1 Tax=Effusibacillus lacus TaxID=1348429 RepID=A0A292YM24_9BACL|nr:hypothetical protein [Effusibacillus lacus]TCS70491.1 hypothetical protein EDD64_13222 [Effusibacillus lacus]GAX89555.1 hypothetical protein EFBL_1179 [Effusibacillus lacus]
MLFEHVRAAGIKRLAIVGIAKHAGKTTALNTIVAEAAEAGIPLSLQSIGVDGERFDALIKAAKPAVQAVAGTLIATAAEALEECTARMTLVEATGIPSAMGEILILRVAEAGNVLLAGVRQVAHAKELNGRFEKWGAQLHIIDGAFDRMACASPDLSDGIVLATGASVGRTVESVVRETKAALARLRMPAVTQDWQRQLAALARTSGCIWAGGPSVTPRMLPDINLLLHPPDSHPDWPQEAMALALPGVVTDGVLEMATGVVTTLIVKDGTRMMASPLQWKRFEHQGGRILAEVPIRIAAVTVNSVSLSGYRLPQQELLASIRALAKDLPVVDCKEGAHEQTES